MPKLVKNYILISYEQLKNDYENTIKRIAKRFNLSVPNSITKIDYNVQTYNHSKGKRVVPVTNKEQKISSEMILEHEDYDGIMEELFLKVVRS